MSDRGTWTLPAIRTFMRDYWGEDDARQMDEALAAHDRKVAAKALREAAQEVRATFSDPERIRPTLPDAKFATDLANDAEWSAMLVDRRADDLEAGE